MFIVRRDFGWRSSCRWREHHSACFTTSPIMNSRHEWRARLLTEVPACEKPGWRLLRGLEAAPDCFLPNGRYARVEQAGNAASASGTRAGRLGYAEATTFACYTLRPPSAGCHTLITLAALLLFAVRLYTVPMLWRNSPRGRPSNAAADFIHPCQPIVPQSGLAGRTS